MKLRPILNPEHLPTGDMYLALNWFETQCRLREIAAVSPDDVVKFLVEEERRVDLAKAFVSDYLCPLRDDVQ